MNERKKELRILIIDVVNRFLNSERISLLDRVHILRPMESMLLHHGVDRDRYLEIRKELTRLVSERIHREFEYSDDVKRSWKKEVFGPMPEMELGIFLEETYDTMSKEYQNMYELQQEIKHPRRR